MSKHWSMYKSTLCYLSMLPPGAKSGPWTSTLILASRREASFDNAYALAGDIIGQDENWDKSHNASSGSRLGCCRWP